MKFKCDCGVHYLKVIKEKNKSLKGWIWVGIYDDKKNLLGDVELNDKETEKLIKFLRGSK